MILQTFNKISFRMVFVAILAISSMMISCSSVSNNKSDLPLIMLGRADFKGDSTSLNIQKFDAALNLALKISGKYNYFGLNQIQQFIGDNPDYANSKINEIAEKIGADYVAVAQVNTLLHIMRTNISLNRLDNIEKSVSGAGYEVVNYYDANNNGLIYDTSLLNSLMRALSTATNDSTLFAKDTIGISIKPVPTLAIGTIAFISDKEISDDWKIYLEKEVNSYAAVETIYDIIKYSKSYVVYDIETRDTVYKLFGFHIVENYTQPSTHEIKALYQMAVDYYVAGSLNMSDSGAELVLGIYSITKEGLKPIKTEKESFVDDSRMVLLEHIIRATKRLFDQP